MGHLDNKTFRNLLEFASQNAKKDYTYKVLENKKMHQYILRNPPFHRQKFHPSFHLTKSHEN